MLDPSSQYVKCLQNGWLLSHLQNYKHQDNLLQGLEGFKVSKCLYIQIYWHDDQQTSYSNFNPKHLFKISCQWTKLVSMFSNQLILLTYKPMDESHYGTEKLWRSLETVWRHHIRGETGLYLPKYKFWIRYKLMPLIGNVVLLYV